MPTYKVSARKPKRKIWKWLLVVCGSLVLLTILVGVISYPKTAAKCIEPLKAPVERSTANRPDDSEAYQIHVVYALPSDGEDHKYDTNGVITTSVSAWQNWLCKQTKGKILALDTYKGMVDISFARLSLNEAEISRGISQIGSQLRKGGFDYSKKAYAIYYDGSITAGGACGGGERGSAVMWLRGNPACADGKYTEDYTMPNYRDLGMLHEIIHVLGFVPDCANNVVGLGGGNTTGHVDDDPNDLLYYQVGGTTASLDKNHDDYYETNIPNCRDLKNSIFLVGDSSELPPDWNQFEDNL